MAPPRSRLVVLVVVLAFLNGIVAHPCESEVASACPDRPGADVAGCLKDAKEHETKTEISSECTDFIALNKACAEDIGSFCDDAFFTADTILCLTQWTDKERLSKKCGSVLAWAVPKEDEEEEKDDGPTDELGMSDKDREEKAEWQAKRKAARGDAIERMKMKEVDRQKEEARVELEKYKEENPEEHAAMMQQQEEDKRQEASFKKMERARVAAFERQKRQQQGLEDEQDSQPKETAKGVKKEAKQDNFIKVVGVLLLGGLGLWACWYHFSGAANKKPSSAKGSKKRR